MYSSLLVYFKTNDRLNEPKPLDVWNVFVEFTNAFKNNNQK